MAVSSETQLCNNSLLRIGASTISSLSDGSTNSAVCQQLYYPTRDALLMQHFWRFTLVRTQLAASSTPPLFEWNNQFPLPSDYMRMKQIYMQASDYRHEGNYLLSNDPSPLNIVYVSQVSDTTQFDALFTEALTLILAIKIAARIGNSDQPTLQALSTQYQEVLQLAKKVNSQDDTPLPLSMTNYIDGRWSGNVDPEVTTYYY